jgi:hypothetical protein
VFGPHSSQLNTEITGVLMENPRPKFVKIPEKTVVTHLAGDIARERIVKVRYRTQTLIVFTSDLRSRREHDDSV